MFQFFRRISYGAIPRADRPWEDDPTSNAPNTKRKRRNSSVERDGDEDDEQVSKRARGDSPSTSVANRAETLEPKPQNDTEEVKQVTQGVHEVTLVADASPADAQASVAPEAVPLPEENPGELEELGANDADAIVVKDTQPAEETPAAVDGDASDVASSSGEDGSSAAAQSKESAQETPATEKISVGDEIPTPAATAVAEEDKHDE